MVKLSQSIVLISPKISNTLKHNTFKVAVSTVESLTYILMQLVVAAKVPVSYRQGAGTKCENTC